MNNQAHLTDYNTAQNAGTHQKNIIAAAFDYIKRGFAIIPLYGSNANGDCTCFHGAKCTKGIGKHPITLNGKWHVIKDVFTARQTFEKYPDANIGLVTGTQSNIFVIDVDKAKKDGDRDGDVADFGVTLPETVEAITGSGGKHLIFRFPNDAIIGCPTRFLDNIDLKGEIGYVVAYPSRHKNGKSYEWVNFKQEIAEATPELIRVILEKDANSRRATLEQFGQVALDKYGVSVSEAGKTSSFIVKAPQRLRFDDEIPEGKRNTTLYKLACRMVGDGLADETICTQIAITNEERCNPPLDDSELETIVKSALKEEKGNRIWQKIENEAGEQDDELNAENVANSDLFLSWNDFKNADFAPLEYLVYGLTRGDVGMIQAISNIGKSSLLRNLAISLTSGLPYHSLCEEGTPKKVLLLDYETTPQMLQCDLATMVSVIPAERQHLVDANLKTYAAKQHADFYLNLKRKDCFDRLKDIVADFQPDVVILDTISTAFEIISENDNSEISNKVLKPLQRLAAAGKCVILYAHHIGKASLENGGASNGVYRGRGASSFSGMCQAVIQLDTKKTTGGETVKELSFEKEKGKKPDAVNLRMNEETRWFEVADGVTAYDNADENYFKLLSLVTEPMKTAEIVEKAVGFISKSTAEKYLKRAVREHKIEQLKHGVYSPTDYIPLDPKTQFGVAA
jgi:archaellum biogenesis ATPase FlaH